MQVPNPVTASLKGEFMNELNYASLEASKKMVENWVVLETDFVWRLGTDGWKLLSKDWVTNMMSNTYESYPAPCFTEVWRELPFQSYIKKLDDGSTLVWICDDDTDGKYIESNMIANTNPTDALIDLLIDLLIWLKGEGNDRRRQKDCG
jgi:hypothetical protein